ncbi:hypothetical protein D3C87_1642210 [compost metagenome]
MVAADVVSSPRDFAAARRLVGGGGVSVTASKLADTSVPLNHLATNATNATNATCAASQVPSNSNSIQVSV